MLESGLDINSASLSARLRGSTQKLHVAAERSGIVRDLLRGTADRWAYALYLRNLLPAYQAIESGLERCHDDRFAVFARRGLFRAPAIEADLLELGGTPPLLAEGHAYADAVARAADGFGLFGHAYVRYMGDLSGGQFLKTHLARTLGLEPGMVNLYDFAGMADPNSVKADVRAALDRIGAADGDAVVGQAIVAFEMTIAVSEAVKRHVS